MISSYPKNTITLMNQASRIKYESIPHHSSTSVITVYIILIIFELRTPPNSTFLAVNSSLGKQFLLLNVRAEECMSTLFVIYFFV